MIDFEIIIVIKFLCMNLVPAPSSGTRELASCFFLFGKIYIGPGSVGARTKERDLFVPDGFFRLKNGAKKGCKPE